MPAYEVDTAVIETVARDLQSAGFVAAAVKATREKFAFCHTEEIAEAREAIVKLELRSGTFRTWRRSSDRIRDRRMGESERNGATTARITDARVRRM